MWLIVLVLTCSVRPVSFFFLGKKYKFRKGDRVGLCPPLWHRDAEIYPAPFEYKPERWTLGADATAEDVAAASVGRIPMSKGGKPLPK